MKRFRRGKNLYQVARNVIDNAIKLTMGERLVIICDRENEEIGRAFQKAALEIKDDVAYYKVEGFSDGRRPAKMPHYVLGDLSKADASIDCADFVEGELVSLREPIYKLFPDTNLRHVTMDGVDEEIMMTGVNVDYGELDAFTKKVLKELEGSSEIKVTTPAGTDFTAKVGKYRWMPCSGIVKPGRWGNIPGGEVFTCPETLNGEIIVDGVLGGEDLDGKYGPLDEMPLRVQVKDGRVVPKSISCRSESLKIDFEWYLSVYENADRIGELAFGTNKSATLVGNILQDEKHLGVHVAFGDPVGEDTGAEWESKSHIDGVLRNPTVHVDDRLLMKDGEYVNL